jgi:DNA-3-methyladenine glycosylase II
VLGAYKRDSDCLRRCGLSRQKHAYLLDLAERFAMNQIPTRRLSRMGDEEVIETLMAVNGIGRWTAEMFLIFTLNRPDVWPVDDLGLRQGAQLLLKLKKTPDAKTLRRLGDQWRPYRSVATWYIWRNLTATRNESRRAAPAKK